MCEIEENIPKSGKMDEKLEKGRKTRLKTPILHLGLFNFGLLMCVLADFSWKSVAHSVKVWYFARVFTVNSGVGDVNFKPLKTLERAYKKNTIPFQNFGRECNLPPGKPCTHPPCTVRGTLWERQFFTNLYFLAQNIQNKFEWRISADLVEFSSISRF